MSGPSAMVFPSYRILMVVGLILVSLPQGLLAKFEQTSLSEQVSRAEVICVGNLKDAGGGGNYEMSDVSYVSAPKDFDRSGTIRFKAHFLRPQDKPTITEGQRVLVLLRKDKNDNFECVAYGSQAIWPKGRIEWPYTKDHESSLQMVVDLTKKLLEGTKVGEDEVLKPDSDEFLANLIASDRPLEQMVGLEMLARSTKVSARILPLAATVQASKGPKGPVSSLAQAILSSIEKK